MMTLGPIRLAGLALGLALAFGQIVVGGPPLLMHDFEEGVEGWTGARGSSRFHVDEILDWPEFCRLVAAENDSDALEGHVRALLPDSARAVAFGALESGIHEDGRWALVEALNGLLDRDDVCPPEMRHAEPASGVLQRFADRGVAAFEGERLRLYNRLLIEAVFRGQIEPLNPASNTRVAPVALPANEAQGGKVLWARPFLASQKAMDVRLEQQMDWREAGDLRFDVLAPSSATGLQVVVYVIDQDNLWYQTSQPRRLTSGEWNRLAIDASPASAEWETRGHGRPWCGYGTKRLEAIGFKFFADRGAGDGVYLDNVVLTRAGRVDERLRLHNFSVTGKTTPRYERFEIAFEINRVYDNPFDPDEIDIRGVFISPSGLVHYVPAFFYQDYERRLDRQVETLTPRGRPGWRIRYAPRETGVHRYFLEIKERGEPARRLFEDPRGFTCVESDNPGYVRVSQEDWRCFEFENGDYFYPIGHNIPASYNAKNAEALGLTVSKHEGTFAYDRFLDGMGRAEENFARIWLASWSFGLEWSRKYSWEYRGLGRYNLRNAWRLDHVLDGCAKRGIYVQLALTTFGHYRSETFEGDWPYSPYNKQNGGPIARPSEFWSSEVCQKYYRRMLRYVGARWGYATHVMSWEISNEIDLVTDYNKVQAEIVQWHKDCVDTIHRYDLGRHLTTTNFAVWQRDPKILSLPEMSYSSTNRYARPLISDLAQVYNLKRQLRKPVLMAECGDNFKGSSAETTRAYIPISLWGAYMMPFAGGGTQWWWDFIEDRDLYHLFKPVARFARGEDRRDPRLDTRNASVAQDGRRGRDGLGVNCLGSKERAYFWVYEEMLLKPDVDWTPSVREGVSVSFDFLADGAYEVEFWHTTRGDVIERKIARSEEGKMDVELPEFVNHIAAKVKPAPSVENETNSIEYSE